MLKLAKQKQTLYRLVAIDMYQWCPCLVIFVQSNEFVFVLFAICKINVNM